MAATLFRRSVSVAVLAATLGAALVAAPALAQRDPAYAAARAAGQVGERMDGYLGFVVPPSGDLKALVEDLNIKRKAVYAQQAQAQHATVEEYAFTAGCQAIARTAPGEKYQAPDGSWATRTSAPPQRDPRCP
ncbi:YdbL family protein [Novosphingobium aerophilum]|uniref:YdbL family protein n=1 Tax=Novosphingobium aerophilum TaxID=2839843 RepID=A0A7X1F8D1_9SPHN|nr:YdbL family protein [Novosphingobium aerophilum]